MANCKLSSLQTEYNGEQWPVFLSLICDELSASITLSIPNTLLWFKGHFPQQAVLPGVVQTHWAALLSTKLFTIEYEINQIANLKFKNIVTPGEEICLHLERKIDKKVIFTYSNNEKIISSGIFKYATAL